jgi:hypothetical protein
LSATDPGLSEEHRRRLDRREIVVLDVLPAGGDARHSTGGTGLAVVHAAPARVWRILVDYAHHAGLYPRVIDVAIVEETGSRAVVRYVVGIGPLSFGFHVTTHPEAARGRLAWRLARDRPNDLFQDSWGYWQVDAHPHCHLCDGRPHPPPGVPRPRGRVGRLIATLRAVRARAEQID